MQENKVKLEITRRQPKTRQGLWNVIRIHRCFSAEGLSLETGMPKDNVKRFIRILLKGGYIADSHVDLASNRKFFSLVRDVGIIAPRLNEDGSLKEPSKTDRMWSAMKVLKRFTFADLSFTANVAKGDACEYCKILSRAGYLKELLKSGKTRITSRTQFIFVGSQDTGPSAPIVDKAGCLFDQNTRCIVWKPEASEVENG